MMSVRPHTIIFFSFTAFYFADILACMDYLLMLSKNLRLKEKGKIFMYLPLYFQVK